jgi:hypothetical protein
MMQDHPDPEQKSKPRKRRQILRILGKASRVGMRADNVLYFTIPALATRITTLKAR